MQNKVGMYGGGGGEGVLADWLKEHKGIVQLTIMKIRGATFEPKTLSSY